MATAGKKFKNLSTTVGVTQVTIITDGQIACERGRLFIHNPNNAGNFLVGLAGENVAFGPPRNGYLISPGGGVVIDDPANNAITAISDTASLPLTIYAIVA